MNSIDLVDQSAWDDSDINLIRAQGRKDPLHKEIPPQKHILINLEH
jgi:hypothetical protein